MTSIPHVKDAAIKKHVSGFQDFLLSERGVSQATLVSYLQDIHTFLDFLGSQAITATVMQEYAQELYAREYSRRTVARKCSSIRMYCLYLYKQDLLEEQPRILMPVAKQAQYLPRLIITLYLRCKILANIKNHYNYLMI